MDLNNRKFQLVLSSFDIGAGKKGAAAGPGALVEALKMRSIDCGEPIRLTPKHEASDAALHPFCKHIDSIQEAAYELNNAIRDVIENNQIPLVFSGDHSNGIGGVSGLKNANPDKRIGVLWIDAHADLHSPYTTPTGNMHGMPLAALTASDNLGLKKNSLSPKESEAWSKLKSIGKYNISPKVNSSDIVFIAIRDAEQEEWSLIEENSILCFEPEDIKTHGIYHVLNESIKKLENCDLIYVSFDVDSLDPTISIGTGTPVPNGLTLTEAEAVFKTLLNLPNLGVFEITEINPSLDREGENMAEVIASVIEIALK
jgi:arginase